MMEIISNNLEDTFKIAKRLSSNFKKGDIIFLEGDLGAGKTAFVKGVVKAYGGDANEVTSPTFTIVNEYHVGFKNIYHFDLYRINNPEELYNIGFEEYFYGQGICFVEWPERAMGLIDGKHKLIKIEKLDGTKRKITYIGD